MKALFSLPTCVERLGLPVRPLAPLVPLMLFMLLAVACSDSGAPGDVAGPVEDAADVSLDAAETATAASGIELSSLSGGKTCDGFTLLIGNQSISGKQKRTLPASQVSGRTMRVRGTHVEFDLDLDTWTVTNYTLTGAPAENPITDQPTLIFLSKRPELPRPLTSGLDIDLNNEQVVLERSAGNQDMKVQAKDCNQGGIFQMEPEPGLVEVNTLAARFDFFRQDPASGRLFFKNGTIAQARRGEAVLGYDSPQTATLLSFTEQRSRWRVRCAAGNCGRIGMVLGEDAIEAFDEAQF